MAKPDWRKLKTIEGRLKCLIVHGDGVFRVEIVPSAQDLNDTQCPHRGICGDDDSYGFAGNNYNEDGSQGIGGFFGVTYCLCNDGPNYVYPTSLEGVLLLEKVLARLEKQHPGKYPHPSTIVA